MSQVLELHELPTDIRAHFLAMPGFQQAMRITKSTSADTGTRSQAIKTLKTSRPQHVKKAANLPGFAQILAGSMGRDIGTPAPAIPKAPAPTTTPTDAVLARANAGAGINRQTHNVPKVPATIPSKGNPVEFASLRAAIDSALHEQRQREQAESFERGRSSFARLAPARESDAPRGGVGDAWSLRNASGKLVQTVLGVRKSASNTMPAGSMRPVTGASLKG